MRALIAILLVAAAFVGGVHVGANPDLPLIGWLKHVIAPDQAEISIGQVEDLIEQSFYEDVPDGTLANGSISGMVEALKDPYSHYFSPQVNKEFKEAISGRYSGVGLAVNEEKRGLLVSDTYEGTPAREAGIREGDIVTEVNGRPIAGVASDLAVARIKGKEGTKVTLTVRRPRDEAGKRLGPPRRYKLTRNQIAIPITDRRLLRRDGRKVGVVQLTSFTETAAAAVAREVTYLEKKKVDGIVLDLRGNGGGRLDQAVAVTSLFLPNGMVVATKGRSRKREQHDVLKNALISASPLVVLVDKGSASASEIVSGALQARDRALVVGTRTFGKGVFQEVTELDNGGAISLTVGRYYLPGNKPLPKNGVKPDLQARDRHATRADEALDAAIAALAEFDK